MNHEYISDTEARIAFVKRAADCFANNKRCWSFTDGEVKPGELLALRWGLDNDCVLVMAIGEQFEPTVYAQAITGAPYKTTTAPEGTPQ